MLLTSSILNRVQESSNERSCIDFTLILWQVGKQQHDTWFLGQRKSLIVIVGMEVACIYVDDSVEGPEGGTEDLCPLCCDAPWVCGKLNQKIGTT